MDNLIAQTEAGIAALDSALRAVDRALAPGPTQSQISRLYTIANNKGWTNAGVKDLLRMNYRIDSTKALTIKEYEEVCDFLEKSIAPNVVTMKPDTNTIDIFKEDK